MGDKQDEDYQIVKDLLPKCAFSPGEKAYAIDAKWFDAWKRSVGVDSEPTNEPVPEIDNSNIVNYLEKQLDVDYYVIASPIWNGLSQIYKGGPPVEVEVGLDPKTGKGIPVTKLHSFKVHFSDKIEKVFISKYLPVAKLVAAACEKFGISNPENYHLRDYWQKKPGRYLFPAQIICEYSIFVNYDLLLEEGPYPSDDEFSESTTNTVSASATRSISASLAPFPQKAQFNSPILLSKPEFPNHALRRGSQSQSRQAHANAEFPPRIKIQDGPRRPSLTGPALFDRSSNPNLHPIPTPPNPATISGTKQNTVFHPENRVSAPSFQPKVENIFPIIQNTRGIINLGNTCYLSSVMQCLIHIPQFASILLDVPKSPQISPSPSTPGAPHFPSATNKASKAAMAQANRSIHYSVDANKMHVKFPSNALAIISDFVKNYFHQGSNQPLSPYELKSVIEKMSGEFSGFMQQDAHEFYIVLLDMLNDALKDKITDVVKTDSSALASDDLKANAEWEVHCKLNNSPIARLFHGQFKQSTVCTNCQDCVNQFPFFTSILLQLPSIKSLSPNITFVPADPREPKISARIPLREGIQNKENYQISLSEFLGRQVEIVFGLLGQDSTVDWIPGPESLVHGRALVIYEIKDPTAIHMSVRLAVNTKTLLSQSNKVVEGPFLIQIPGPNTSKDQVLDICSKYFSYLFEPVTAKESRISIPPELSQIITQVKSIKNATSKFEVELSKSLFSKTMRFKPMQDVPCIAQRTVIATLAIIEGISWPRVIRNTIKSASNTTKKSASLTTLIDEAATPSLFQDKWKCSHCNQTVHPKKSSSIYRLPPVLVFGFKRFEGSKSNLRKNDIPVTYPDTLELSDCTGTYKYALNGVVEHGGKMGGHYTAHSKISETTWAEFNDTQVFNCTQEAAHVPNAMMLFYLRVDP